MLLFLFAAIAVGSGLVFGMASWWLRISTYEGEAKGAHVRMTFEADCPEAELILEARLADYGLPATSAGPLAWDVTLPGVLADEATHMPKALAAPGKLAVTVNGAPQPVAIDNVGMQLAFSGVPVTLLMLKDPLPEEGVKVTIDGEEIPVEEVTGPELQLAAYSTQSTEALRLATDRAVMLRRPLPCPVRVATR